MAGLLRADEALAWARAQLDAAPGAEPLDAALLLAHVLDLPRAALLAHPETPLSAGQRARFAALVTRRAAGEPVAYLTGRHAFYDRDFLVTPDVLIPRPETEHLIEAALNWARERADRGAGLRVVDVGTGSGAIAVTLAAHLPDASLHAIDCSPAALEVARRNADRAGVAGRIAFHQGDLLRPLLEAGERMDLIAANLPYIPSADLDTLDVARYEPRLALDGGPDGLDAIRRLLEQATDALAASGLALLEIGAGQGARAAALAENAFPGAAIAVLADYAGHDRLLRVERSG